VLAVALGLVAASGFGTADFLGGLASRRIGCREVVLAGQIIGLVALSLPLLAGGATPDAGSLGLGVGAGVMGSVGLMILYRAMELGSIGATAPVGGLGAALPAALALLIGERPGLEALAGMLVAIVGVMLVCRAEGPPVRARLALSAAACFGGFFWLVGRAAERQLVWAVVGARIGGVVVAGLAAGGLTSLRRVTRVDGLLVGAMAFCEVSADLAFVAAATRGYLSVAAVLATLSPLTSVTLACLVAGERLEARQTVGVVLALGGVLLLAG
jgi:drug/metabolite transporter (DMT)-like permease